MPIVKSRKMLIDARKNGYAIGAFNVENLEMTQAVVNAAVRCKSPIIVAVSQSSCRYADVTTFASLIRNMAELADVPIALHLDHSESFELAIKALYSGFTSIMIDGSKKSYQENINLTKSVVNVCKLFDVPVEGELGAIVGKAIDDEQNRKMELTRPEIAYDYVQKTGVSSLAVAIGNKHGVYKGKPNLDYEKLTNIKERVNVPLVLHGASGLSDDELRKCISHGISKVNIATDLRIAYTETIKKFLNNDIKYSIDPRKYGNEAEKAVEEIVKSRLEVLGSVGRA